MQGFLPSCPPRCCLTMRVSLRLTGACVQYGFAFCRSPKWEEAGPVGRRRARWRATDSGASSWSGRPADSEMETEIYIDSFTPSSILEPTSRPVSLTQSPLPRHVFSTLTLGLICTVIHRQAYFQPSTIFLATSEQHLLLGTRAWPSRDDDPTKLQRRHVGTNGSGQDRPPPGPLDFDFNSDSGSGDG